MEAQWYYNGYMPSFDEYLSNGRVSITAPLMTMYSYLTTSNPIKKEAIEFIEGLPDIIGLAGEVFRLADDYGTSSV